MPSSYEEVKTFLASKSPDVCVLLETKRRHEEIGSCIKVDGYSVNEIRRSDTAGDRSGGGLAYYSRLSDGIIFQNASPSISSPDLHYVMNERFWITTVSVSTKTAICGLYLGCQYAGDRYGE